MSTLTRKTQVIEALLAGGSIPRISPARALLQLRAADGREIAAWQQAISAAVRELHIVPTQEKP